MRKVNEYIPTITVSTSYSITS